ncbi:MAG TPA: acyl carrier protein [Ktedonobacterales bacterium]
MTKPTQTLDTALIRDQIRDFITQNFLYNGNGTTAQLDNGASLLEQGIVDTTGVLELVLFVEETYAFSVDQNDLLPENFDSIDNLAAYVARHLVAE